MKYKFIVLEKDGEVSIKSTKSIDTLYKTCGYRKNSDFITLNNWEDITINNVVYSISLWGKNVGKNNNVNDSDFIKHCFTQPIYGSVVFVFMCGLSICEDVNIELWEEFKNQINQCSISNDVNSDSDYTFDDDNECNSVENNGKENDNKLITNELTYETYLFSEED